MVLADKAYDATEIRTFVAGRTSHPGGTGAIRSAVVRIPDGIEITLSGYSNGPNTVGASL